MPNQEEVPAWAQSLIDQNKTFTEQLAGLEHKTQEAKKKEPEKKEEEPVDPDLVEAIINNISGFPSKSKEKKVPSQSSKLPADVKKKTDEIMKFL